MIGSLRCNFRGPWIKKRFVIVSTEFGKTDEAEYMLKETEKQLKKKYPNVYDGTNQNMIPVPPQYDFGVEGKGTFILV